jgi:hypothetical protein
VATFCGLDETPLKPVLQLLSAVYDPSLFILQLVLCIFPVVVQTYFFYSFISHGSFFIHGGGGRHLGFMSNLSCAISRFKHDYKLADEDLELARQHALLLKEEIRALNSRKNSFYCSPRTAGMENYESNEIPETSKLAMEEFLSQRPFRPLMSYFLLSRRPFLCVLNRIHGGVE